MWATFRISLYNKLEVYFSSLIIILQSHAWTCEFKKHPQLQHYPIPVAMLPRSKVNVRSYCQKPQQLYIHLSLPSMKLIGCTAKELQAEKGSLMEYVSEGHGSKVKGQCEVIPPKGTTT